LTTAVSLKHYARSFKLKESDELAISSDSEKSSFSNIVRNQLS